jgi:hypothetical protein
MKRFFDLLVALVAVVFLALPILIVTLAVQLASQGPAHHWSGREGRHNRFSKCPNSAACADRYIVCPLKSDPSCDVWLLSRWWTEE